MVLGILGLMIVTAVPTVTGVGQAISAQKKANAANKEKEKFHVTAIVEQPDGENIETDFCVLKDGKLVLNIPGDDQAPVTEGHAFCGYYFTYPSEEKHMGLVSTISDDPPMLNWLYIDNDTQAMQYGARKDTVGHVIGPWGWSEDDKFLTLEGEHEDFVAVRDGEDGRWVVFWDPEEKLQATMDVEDCRNLRLRRRMLLGMESRYVRD